MKQILRSISFVLKALIRIEHKLDIIISVSVKDKLPLSRLTQLDDSFQIDPVTNKQVSYTRYSVSDGIEILVRNNDKEVPMTGAIVEL